MAIADRLWQAAERLRETAPELAKALAVDSFTTRALAAALTPRNQSGTDRVMVSAARARISKGRTDQGSQAAVLVAKASEQGHTLRSLAELVEQRTKKPRPNISRSLAGRPIRKSAADVIEQETGYKATSANWPGGWASED